MSDFGQQLEALRTTYETLRAVDEKRATDALFDFIRDAWTGRDPEVVSLVRVEPSGGNHARLEVWNRGGKAGVLTVEVRDVGELVRRLAPRRREP